MLAVMDEPQGQRRRVARRSAGPPVAATAVAEPSGPDRATADGPPDPGQVDDRPVAAGTESAEHPPVPGPLERRYRQRSRPDRTSSASADSDPFDPERPDPDAGEPDSRTPAPAPRNRPEHSSERSLRSLVSTRSTQVSPTIAMRAREVAVPTAADLAEAERDLVIVRRHYTPPTPLTAGRKRPSEQPRRRRGDAE